MIPTYSGIGHRKNGCSPSGVQPVQTRRAGDCRRLCPDSADFDGCQIICTYLRGATFSGNPKQPGDITVVTSRSGVHSCHHHRWHAHHCRSLLGVTTVPFVMDACADTDTICGGVLNGSGAVGNGDGGGGSSGGGPAPLQGGWARDRDLPFPSTRDENGLGSSAAGTMPSSARSTVSYRPGGTGTGRRLCCRLFRRPCQLPCPCGTRGWGGREAVEAAAVSRIWAAAAEAAEPGGAVVLGGRVPRRVVSERPPAAAPAAVGAAAAVAIATDAGDYGRPAERAGRGVRCGKSAGSGFSPPTVH